jgi:hypothetical protein
MSPEPSFRQREGGRIVSVAAIIAVACDAEGWGEIVGLHIGPSEAETFRAAFLKSLVKRGLKGVKLVVSDAHEGLKAAIARVLGATWQRCRVHWMRNALAHVGKARQPTASAALRQAFLQPDQESARQTWRHVADQLDTSGNPWRCGCDGDSLVGEATRRERGMSSGQSGSWSCRIGCVSFRRRATRWRSSPPPSMSNCSAPI